MLILFRNPRFRLLFVSVIINYVGLMTHFTIHGWLALTVTDSPFWVGATAGAGGLGLMSFSLVSGVLVDRMNRRNLIIIAQMLQVVIAAAMAILIFTEEIRLWHVLLVAYLDGTFLAVKVPARFALVLDVVGRENLLRGTAANFAAMTMMGIAIPPLAGYMVGSIGIGWAYVMMANAFFWSALLLLFLRGIKARVREQKTSPIHDMKEGIRYVFTTPQVRALIIMGLTSEAFGWAHETMLPVMARDVLGTGPEGLGLLLSAGSVGALITSLVMSNLDDVKNKGRMLVGGYIGFGVFLILFAMSPWLLLSLVLIAVAYSMVALYETTLSTLLQTSVPDEMRGRVLSFQTFTWGVTGTSGFHTGTIATLLGAPVAIAIGGGVLVLNGLRIVRGLRRRFPEPQAEVAAGD